MRAAPRKSARTDVRGYAGVAADVSRRKHPSRPPLDFPTCAHISQEITAESDRVPGFQEKFFGRRYLVINTVVMASSGWTFASKGTTQNP